MTREIRAKDLLKPPTAISVGALSLVVDGSRKLDTRAGKCEVAIGRLGDIADGFVARSLDMTSDAGAIADVTCDKLGMLAIGLGAWQKDIAPKPLLAAMGAKHVINAAATLYNGLADEKKRSIRPPKSGKYSMAADNISLGAFLLADELGPESRAYTAVRALGYTAAMAGFAYGAVATHHYVNNEFSEET